MTSQLQRDFAEAEKHPAQDQDTIAARLLAEVEDERQWNARFAATTEDQWDRMAAEVRADGAANRTVPLDDVISADAASR
jgi:hypothetical protein